MGHLSIPTTMNVTPNNKKLYLGILQHLEQLLGLGLSTWVRVRVKHLGLGLGLRTGLGLSTALGLGLGLSTFRVRVRVKCILFRWMTSPLTAVP